MRSTREVGGYLRFSTERAVVACGMPSFPITASTKLRTRSKQVHLTVTETEDEKQLTLPVMIPLSAAQVLLCCLAWVFSFLFEHKSLCLHGRHISSTPGGSRRKPHLEVSLGRWSSLMKHNLHLNTIYSTVLINRCMCPSYPLGLKSTQVFWKCQSGDLFFCKL